MSHSANSPVMTSCGLAEFPSTYQTATDSIIPFTCCTSYHFSLMFMLHVSNYLTGYYLGLLLQQAAVLLFGTFL